MNHDLSAQPSPSSYGTGHSREPSSSAAAGFNNSDPAAAATQNHAALSLQDYLASVMSPNTLAATLPPPVSGYEGYGSPADAQPNTAAPVNFADILAEFTLAQNAFSPDATSNAPSNAPTAAGSQRGGDSSAESTSPMLAPSTTNNGAKPDADGSAQQDGLAQEQGKSAQEVLLEQLRALYPATPAAVQQPPANAAPDSSHMQTAPQQQQQQQQQRQQQQQQRQQQQHQPHHRHPSHAEAQPSPLGQQHHESVPASSPSSTSSQGIQLGPEMQVQLQQWLAQSLAMNGHGVMSSQTPTPTGPPVQASSGQEQHHGASSGFHAPAHLQPQHQEQYAHQQSYPSPHGYPPPQSPSGLTFPHPHSAPTSQHTSPMPFHASTPRDQQQYPGSGPGTPIGHPPGPSSSSFAMNQPLPFSPNMPGPAAAAAAALTPFLSGLQANSSGGTNLQAQLAALQMLVNANAQAQAQAQIQAHVQSQANGMPRHLQQQQHHHQQHQQHHQSQAHGQPSHHEQYQQQQQQQQQYQHQHQPAPRPEHAQATPLQQHTGHQQTPFEIRTSAPGTASSSYRETDYIFSPLMSPVMTPHSAFTNASSLPPSVGPVPLVTPTDCFPPLTSPALGPQMFGSDHASRQHRHRNSLQGLVDGVGALSTQLPPGSPNGSYYSPRVGPSDPTPSTGPGSSRRGASGARSKTRPSPLIKPIAEAGKRRKTQSAVSTPSEKRGNGQTSATASPSIQAVTQLSGTGGARGSERASSTFSGASSSHIGASPGEGGSGPSIDASANGSGGSAGGIDTPSPVDLASSVQYHQHQPLVAPSLREAATVANATNAPTGADIESMGPPPLPAPALNPITPASFMNFDQDFNMDGLSSLSPALSAVQRADFDPVSSALSSLQNSPALLPQTSQSNAPGLSLPPLITEETFRAPPQPSASGKATKVRKTPSARASPALKPVDSKGKSKAGANSEKASGAAGSSRGKGTTTKPAKIAPSPKIAPTRPGATPDALKPTRGAGKGKDESDAGIDVLGLPPSVTSDIQISPLNKNEKELPDNRRSSHKVAEQKRRDSLKLCFDELRRILPPILPYTDEQDRRPGDGNVGGQRHGEIDPDNPNKGVSKVALLRRSNEYLGILRERIDRRDRAISSLRSQITQLREHFGMEELGEDDDEVPGLDLDLDNIDKEEKQAGNLAFYEDLDFDEKVMSGEISRRTNTSRRSSVSAPAASAAEAKPSRAGTRRSKRQQAPEDMDVEA
ncbi:hypothetical protein JCM10908_004700 [Rhodotorula pacifica]|uniref:uncharacterized protein n=1 Tax=Rhodotorula pacifica TaxID=1495444 RepID=UPI003177D195